MGADVYFDSLSENDANLMRQFIVGLVSYEDAIRKAESKNDLRLALKRYLMPGWRLESGGDDDGGPSEEPSITKGPRAPLKPGSTAKDEGDT